MQRRLLIYEDDDDLRRQLTNLVYALRGEFELAGAFADISQLETQLSQLQPHVVVMDIQLQGDDDGILALYLIKKRFQAIRVLMLTMFDTDDKVFNSICLGADGYMLKSDFTSRQLPQDALRKAIRTLYEGGAYITPSIARKIIRLFSENELQDRIQSVRQRFQDWFSTRSDEKPSSAYRLTPAQHGILKQIATGRQTREIARDLGISENTVNTHIKAIYSELEVHSRTMALRKALEARLI